METTSSGILGRLGEKAITWIGLALLVLVGISLRRMGPEARGALWSGIWRTAAWVVIVAAVPWSARLFIGKIIEVGSNWASLILLASLTALELIVGLILLGGLPAGGWGWTGALAALAVAGTYNYLVTEYLSDMAGG